MLDRQPNLTKSAITTARYWPFQTASVRTPNPLAPMLKALFAAAEAALERDLRTALIGTYALRGRYAGRYLTESASIELGVNTYQRLFRDVDFLVSALKLEAECIDYDVPRHPSEPMYQVVWNLFLTIEYTRSSMTAAILDQECGTYEMLSRVSSSDYGYDAMEACRDAAENSTSCDDFLQNALRKVVKDALTTPEEYHLDAALVFGEKADDENLAVVLREVLDDSFSNGTSIMLGKVREFSPDLTFASSRAMAMFALENEEWQREHGKQWNSQHGEL